ncbi:hemophore-related protein [Nocardia sp. alder85J]|uniref:hemophore-related protein n=1 Tax=Nocardia sp. alder85J TaxID=2862949 RepID=UPI001CD1948F|nr:hemophore-related protein [Nocardia sp. alder85J]MCX4096012.1 hemophore-related protein [Nocardia sp. alder85J]
MKRIAAGLLAGVAGLAAVVVAVPGIAGADGPQCNPQARAQARTVARGQVEAYLAGHPDVAAEVTKVKGLPKEQRRAEWQAYRQANPQQAREFRAARQPIIDYRAACHR